MPRAPLTEEQKQVLRDRLKTARDAKAKKIAERGDSPEPPKKLPQARSITRTDNLYTQWTEQQWMDAPIEDCRSRLALLKVDFECGSKIVGQRRDVNDPTSYKCFVCNAPVPESKWVWKHDYLDHMTGLFKSVVICNQTCHTVYVNDTRLQQSLKAIVSGQPAPTEESVA
jgi:hypothetical protein